MSRKRKNSTRTKGRLLSVIAWHKVRRPLWYACCLSAVLTAGYAGSQALARFDEHLNQTLLERSPQPTVEFPELPDGLLALAGGDLRGSIADLLERPWTQPDLCRLIAERLAAVGWIERIDSVRRTHAGRFEIIAQYRIPAALVATHKSDYVLVDSQGIRLPGLYVYHDRWYVIEGVDSAPPKVGDLWSSPDLQAGLSVLTALRSEPFRGQIRGLNVANFAGRKNAHHTHLEVLTDIQGGRIRWGSAPGYEVEENLPPQKLALLRQNYAQTGRADAGHDVIDISTFPDRFHLPG